MMPNDGVGLARMEFIINEHIGVHPMALVHPDRVSRARIARAIAERARGFASPRDVLRAQPGRGRRHDRRGLLSAGR